MYTQRFYRGWTAGGRLHVWNTVLGESDLEIHASKPMKGFAKSAQDPWRRLRERLPRER